MKPRVVAFFDEATFTISYLVIEPAGSRAAIIDSVLDFDPKSGRTNREHADRIIEFVRSQGLTIDWILETHVHADHLTAAPYLKSKLGGKTGIGTRVSIVQSVFREIFNAESDFRADGSQFDHLFQDGEEFAIGTLTVRVMSTPGHTPACVSYVIGDAAFVGDTLFMPDYGTARADFPGGDAAELYRSIRKILDLPSETRLFTCHDYKAPGRDIYAWESSVAEQRRANVHIKDGISESEFVAMRKARDKTLQMPVLLIPSVQVNMRAGELPPPEANGVRYLKMPLDRL